MTHAARERAALAACRARLEGARAVPLGAVTGAFGEAGGWMLLQGLALLNILLSPLPGVSLPLGLALALVAWHLARGEAAIALPGWAARRTLGAEGLARALHGAERAYDVLDRWRRQRWPAWTGRGARHAATALCVPLAMLVALPVPFANVPPALAIVLLGAGLAAGDGAMVAAGGVLAVLTLAGVGAFGALLVA